MSRTPAYTPKESAVTTYLLPDDSAAMLRALHADLGACRQRLLLACFLPPCPRLLPHVEQAARRARHSSVWIDGSTTNSLRRFDAEWMQRVRLLGGGTLHAKVLVCDGVLWWGSWNMSVTAMKQYDVAQRSTDAALLRRVLVWLGHLPSRSRVVPCGSDAPGAFVRKDGAPGDARGEALRADPNYDPDLGF